MGIKYKVNEKFFERWKPIMAYVLGYIYADGHLEDASYIRGKYFRVTSAEKNNLLKIKNWLSSEHRLVYRKSFHKNDKVTYQIRIGSHKMYNDLRALGLYPNKSLAISFPKIPKKYLKDFIRGYFDGDGCVFLERKKNNKNKYIIKKLSIIFTSGSKKFLEGLNNVLKENNLVIGNKIYNSHRSLQLRYNTSESILLFKFMYRNVPKNLYIKRKLKIFINYFILRPSKLDRSSKNVIESLNMATWRSS